MPQQGPLSPLNRQRWVEAQNVGSQSIPAFGCVEIAGTVYGDESGRVIFQVKRPTADNVAAFAFNGNLAIPVGTSASPGKGQVTLDYPAFGLYTGSAPSVGSELGPTEGSFYLTAGNTGMLAVDVDSGGLGRVRVMPKLQFASNVLIQGVVTGAPTSGSYPVDLYYELNPTGESTTAKYEWINRDAEDLKVIVSGSRVWMMLDDAGDLQIVRGESITDSVRSLTDTTISSETAGDILQWTGPESGSAGGWENVALADSGLALESHEHDTADIITGTLPVARGGTGVSNTNLLDAALLGSQSAFAAGYFLRAGTGTSTSWASISLDDIATAGTDFYAPGDALIPIGEGGTGSALTDPNADRLMFWDDSAGAVAWLTAGSGLTITGTTITASASGPIGGLSDVDLSSLTSGEILVWDFDRFRNNTLSEAGIAAANHTHTASDIDAESSTDGYVLTSDGGGNAVWEAISAPSSIDDLSDVTLDSLGDGEVLVSSSGDFINQTLAEAGIAAASHTHSADDITSGTLPVARGGTGVTALSSLDAADLGSGAGTDGYVLTADGAGGAAWEEIASPHDAVTLSGSYDYLSIDGSQVITLAQIDLTTDVTGTLPHEQGGLEADVSTYDGLVRITAGSTSAVTVSTFGLARIADADASAARSALDVDQAGTDNSTDVSLSGSYDYITIDGSQVITVGQVDLSTDVTGTLPIGSTSFDAADFVTGTANQVIVTDDMDGTITLSGPQNLGTSNTPQFAGLGLGTSGSSNTISGASTITLAPGSGSVIIAAPTNSDGFQVKSGSTLRVDARADGSVRWGNTGDQGRFSWDTGKVLIYGTSGNAVQMSAGGVGSQFWLDTNGRVAINESSPGAKLHIDQSSTTGAIPVLTLDQGDVSEEFIRFIGTSTTTAANSLVDAADMTTPGTLAGWVKAYIQDDAASGAITDGVYYFPFYTEPTA